MPKRKSVRKAARSAAVQKKISVQETKAMPVPALAIKVLSLILAAILIAALTLYVLGRMPARGFWTLAVVLAIIAFGVLPWMRKKYGGG